jgi:glutaryl-CoA dehydrogenase|tara:strand:+ start:5102 stop:6265 length:1164 start_codon:yes stop_codon:yes gene_type:complete
MNTSDVFNIEAHYTDEQMLIKDTIKTWVNQKVKPVIEEHFLDGSSIKNIVKELAEIGAFGFIFPEKYGGLNMDYVSYGILMQELERGDSSIRVIASIQTSLVMFAISQFGSDDQKNEYLPKLSSGEYLGAFGLTEPSFGSNPAGMHSYYYEDGDNIVINGSKMWIGNSELSDIAIAWMKDESGNVKGVIVDRYKITNFNATTFQDKWSFRASKTGELVFSNSVLPKGQVLQNSKSIKDAYECLNIGRYAVACGSIGIALECFEIALNYSKERIQFGLPIGSKQLIQKKLAEMSTEITKAQLLCFHLGKLLDSGSYGHEQISLAKRNNVRMAQKIARDSREILGGMGISSEYPIMRHLINTETLVTYQGTNEIHELILGKALTGLNAF